MKCPLPVRNKRRVLCVFPTYTPAFGTFQHAYKLMYRVKAFMPPQGLLLIAAYMPEIWPVRFVDENIKPATDADLAWADVVLVTGMHIQAEQIRDIQRRAKAAGKVTVLGGPSVSASPEIYPGFDYLHCGELGDATDEIVAELDNIFSQPNPPTTLYFVDDNFIGNRKAAKEMLPHLVEWQKKHGYPVMFACEATLNIAKQVDILALMKEANFVGMFVGIETPDARSEERR